MQNNERAGEKRQGVRITRKGIRITRKRVIIAVVVLILAAMFVPAIYCEIQTSLYLDMFEGTMLEDLGETQKVLSVTYDSAKIYVYSDGDEEGEDCLGGIVRLKREYNDYETGPWEIAGWEPYWSDGEGANRVVWQYWWHFTYFLF